MADNDTQSDGQPAGSGGPDKPLAQCSRRVAGHDRGCSWLFLLPMHIAGHAREPLRRDPDFLCDPGGILRRSGADPGRVPTLRRRRIRAGLAAAPDRRVDSAAAGALFRRDDCSQRGHRQPGELPRRRADGERSVLRPELPCDEAAVRRLSARSAPERQSASIVMWFRARRDSSSEDERDPAADRGRDGHLSRSRCRPRSRRTGWPLRPRHASSVIRARSRVVAVARAVGVQRRRSEYARFKRC